ncbi:NAD-dependent epimerase/dehydratase family protein [Flaviflexus huanghaiensis]|uniref:NAD-dependent epimerase/dehydratase family protein n=1 Tax=Flaviflexus huanghaiensis TaxID=1111473 RepID=UPI0015FC9989|nr:NAD-dependent epimerase/dehydratase family protein [Flaviflexus huanghaiensis]
MRVGVIGARGFIGSNLTTALEQSGHEPVAFTQDRPITSPEGRAAGYGMDGAVWVASTSTPAIVGQNPETAEAELTLFRDSLHAMADLEIGRFVLVSSGGTVYGRAPAPSSEDDELAPANSYGRLKATMERVAREHRPDTTILRLSNVYGPGQLAKGGQGVLGHWLDAVANGRPPVIFGEPTIARDYVFIRDCADAIIAALERDAAIGETINIGSGEPTTLSELLSIVQDVTGLAVDPRVEPGRPFDNSSTWLRIERADTILDWRPTTPLVEGVKAMWDWKVGR